MASLDINCPHCQGLVTVTEEFASSNISCPLCSGQFVVPDLGQFGVQGSVGMAQKREVWKAGYWMGAILVPAFAWIFALYKIVIKEDEDPGIYTTMALLTTIIAPIVAVIFLMRALSVAKNAVEVTGTILKLSAPRDLMLDVTFQYQHAGKTYKQRKSFGNERGFVVGGPIELVIDSRKPKRCYQKSQFYK